MVAVWAAGLDEMFGWFEVQLRVLARLGMVRWVTGVGWILQLVTEGVLTLQQRWESPIVLG
jgi:hypothetical protein